MAKNKIIKFMHDEFGPLVIKINANNDLESTIIPENITKSYAKSSMEDFLNTLYIQNIKNDILTTIISDYMVDSKQRSKEEIVSLINSRYQKIIEKQARHRDTPLECNDHITVTIELAEVEDNSEPLYNAEVDIKQDGNHLYAYVDTNVTREDCRHKGLQSLGFRYLENYLANYDIPQVKLEAIDLDANDFDLNKVYANLGYEKIGSQFVKNISSSMEMYN